MLFFLVGLWVFAGRGGVVVVCCLCVGVGFVGAVVVWGVRVGERMVVVGLVGGWYVFCYWCWLSSVGGFGGGFVC